MGLIANMLGLQSDDEYRAERARVRAQERAMAAHVGQCPAARAAQRDDPRVYCSVCGNTSGN